MSAPPRRCKAKLLTPDVTGLIIYFSIALVIMRVLCCRLNGLRPSAQHKLWDCRGQRARLQL